MTKVKSDYILKKFPGKGGWTYAEIPEIAQNKNSPFGWVRVSGTIDGYPLHQYKLMPMGNGKLFLPVKASIRKKIKKEEGDIIHVDIYVDEVPNEMTEELMECFRNEDPGLLKRFYALPAFEQRAIIQNIYDAKTEDEKSVRIVRLFNSLSEK